MKTIRKIRVVALLAVIILLLAHTVSFASSGNQQKSAITITSTGTLSFGTMLGAEGKYWSNEVSFSILASQGISVTFSAEPFAYNIVGPLGDRPTLDVTYWVKVNGETEKFTPKGSDLTIEREYQSDAYMFTLCGEVQIHNIHDQPAGQYSGTILVTISGWQP